MSDSPATDLPAAKLAAVILAGGMARRLGGVDKAALEVGGRSLLDRVLDAVAAADPVVVVGPRRQATRPVRWARERPAGGGPVVALSAGMALLPRDVLVAVLAGDLVRINVSTVDRLRAACSSTVDGAVLVDASGRPQWLIGVWWAAALRRALSGEPAGAGSALRSVLGRLRVAEVAEVEGESADVDTQADLDRVRSDDR